MSKGDVEAIHVLIQVLQDWKDWDAASTLLENATKGTRQGVQEAAAQEPQQAWRGPDKTVRKARKAELQRSAAGGGGNGQGAQGMMVEEEVLEGQDGDAIAPAAVLPTAASTQAAEDKEDEGIISLSPAVGARKNLLGSLVGAQLPTTTLAIRTGLLCPALAPRIAAALPHLTELVLHGPHALTSFLGLPQEVSAPGSHSACTTSQEVASGLAALLGRTPCGGGSALLPHLRALRLERFPVRADCSLRPDVWDALQGCSQLRKLAAPGRGYSPQLGLLTQLRSLELSGGGGCAPGGLPPGLTTLRIATDLCSGPTRRRQSLGDFAALRSLRRLSLPSYELEFTGAEDLPALTYLEALGLRAAPGDEEGQRVPPAAADGDGAAAADMIFRRRLPPALAELVLHGRDRSQGIGAGMLAALDPPAGLATIRVPAALLVDGSLVREGHDGGGGAVRQLAPRGEAALIAAFWCLGGRVEWLPPEPDPPLSAAGTEPADAAVTHEEAEAGTGAEPAQALWLRFGGSAGRPVSAAQLPQGHGLWLTALGLVRPALTGLLLEGVALSGADLQALALGCPSLRSLGLATCELHPFSLLELAAMPHLSLLRLGVGNWLTLPASAEEGEQGGAHVQEEGEGEAGADSEGEGCEDEGEEWEEGEEEEWEAWGEVQAGDAFLLDTGYLMERQHDTPALGQLPAALATLCHAAARLDKVLLGVEGVRRPDRQRHGGLYRLLEETAALLGWAELPPGRVALMPDRWPA
ncbi:hypothetical protein GPECTOR_2g1593 [Gonium pectorale]|uniref:Uncharacterized protein n=1 Tax=Gonium pectorale TaxID=33097 RepID=A0A150H1R9_GONPE|nr:hypothetical protein GPECTOR_2g1593 [Gonium pectorale]|eukprot:KXZ56041.1 hypothetical protein GPECTOR_2g1593 [Gonium pectorale]